MTVVLDASAALAFLQGESGSDAVEDALARGAVMSAANWSEVAQKVLARGGEWSISRALLLSYGLIVEAVSRNDAETAAALWRRGSGMSLADRLCLALGERLEIEVLTADTAWGDDGRVRQIR